MTRLQLTDEQRLALETLRVRHGARWKHRLTQIWKAGTENTEHYSKVLKQLRTVIGPEKLGSLALD